MTDDFEHIGDINSAHHDCDDTTNWNMHQAMSSEIELNPKAVAHRPLPSYITSTHDGDDNDAHHVSSENLLDPTLGYITKATVVIPVAMILDDVTYGQKTNNAHSSGNNTHPDPIAMSVAQPPTYSIDLSRLALYAAFPPPPIILQKGRQSANKHISNSQDLSEAKQRLKRHSGFHGAVGVSSATHQEHGFVNTSFSINYRYPKLLSVPTRAHPVPLVGNMHCNLHLGSNTNQSLGGSLSSLDGATMICLDVSNPYPKPHSLDATHGILPHRKDGRSYTISSSRDFSRLNNPLRIQGVIMLAPLPYSNLIGQHKQPRTLNTSHLERFALVMTNLNSYEDTQVKDQQRYLHKKGKPKISVSLGYGKGCNTWYSFPQSCNYIEDVNITRDRIKSPSGYPSAYSASVEIDVKQQLSPSQAFQSVIKYRHVGKTLTLGATITRTFLSSPFSRLGVGIRHVFQNIWDPKLWKQGNIWWILQFERGDAIFYIPIMIYPVASTTIESFIRLFYASFASLTVDAIIGELLCDATSVLRVHLLQRLLGKGCFRNDTLNSASDANIKQQQEEDRMMDHHDGIARVHALKQRDAMTKQAINSARRESEQGGLVIIKAIYGVTNENQQWIARRNERDKNTRLFALDATVQLQFWVNNGSLRMPPISKKNMLGFYNILDCVNNSEWIADSLTTSGDDSDVIPSNIFQNAYQWCRRQWNEEEPEPTSESRRNLVVVLSVRYKYDNKVYDIIFLDAEEVELPNSRSKVVDTGSLQ